MNTKILMTSSAVLLGILGLLLTFLPKEVLLYFSDGESVSKLSVISMQMAGALYFAMGMINWTSRANLIGGIYGRPIAIGNLVHFFMGAMVLMRGPVALIAVTILYFILAAAFYIVFVTHPVKNGILNSK